MTILPVPRHSLADDLAQRVKQLIQDRSYQPGDRLPTIQEMASRFGVGHPTLREALTKLETLGQINVKHGSGVYVGEHHNTLFVPNPVFHEGVSKKLLLDLIEARIPIELKSVALAAVHATAEHLDDMEQLLENAGQNFDDDVVLNSANMAFHRQIALASGNTVLHQILEVLGSLFRQEQRWILDIYGSRQKDHAEHLGILKALQERDEAVVVERMRAHLEGVREVLLRWDPNDKPVAKRD